MQFTSFGFLPFAALVLLAYWVTPKKARWITLLLASYVFYIFAGVEYLWFMLFTTATTYITTLCMDNILQKQAAFLKENKALLSREEKKACKAATKKKTRLFMVLCLLLNFGMLAVCKGLLIDPFRTMASGSFLSFLSIGLPLGMSFYLFQSMGYVVDIHRGTAKAERNPFKLALFVSFFPQLIQGPISQFSVLAPQMYAPKDFDGKEFSFGLQRLLWGYFKKLVIADRIAAAVGTLKGFEGTGFFLLTVFYAVQLYADFTGGIDMAIGLSQSLGIKLPENFIRPYFSKNIAEYWRRWHITLGEWMKSYIFYPISVSQPMLKLSKAARTKLGNFGKRLPVYVASIATWAVTGIWHGLSPNFLLWGMLNCFVIVVSEELVPLYEKFHNRFPGLKQKKLYGGFEILRMFILMNLIRIVDLFPNVLDYFKRMGSLVTTWNVNILWDGTLLNLGLSPLDYGILGGAIALVFAVSLYQEKKGSVREMLWTKPALRYILVFALLLVTVLMGSYGIGYNASNFIYNQF